MNNEKLDKVNAWCVDKCGLTPYEDFLYRGNDGEHHYVTRVSIGGLPTPCSIKNATFRELVRQVFTIDTVTMNNNDDSELPIGTVYCRSIPKECDATGVNLSEAEINCIEAIYDLGLNENTR